MAERSAALKSHNDELIHCIEDLREKRSDIQRQIQADEAQRDRIQKELASLTRELSQINNSLSKKVATCSEYDKVIEETETAYVKILESSQALLEVLKRESINMQKKRQTLLAA